MKIEKFLTCVQTEILNRPEVDFPTLKLFMNKFSKCLSKRELDRWHLSLQMIMEFTSKQLTIDEISTNIVIAELDVKHKELTKGGKKK